MSGTTPISSYIVTNNSSMTNTVYLTALDGNSVAAARGSAAFAPYGSTAMTVNVMPGHLFDGATLTESSAWTSSVITAPVSNSRIDRIVLDQLTGAPSIVTGVASGSPSAPAIPIGKVPCAQIVIASTTATIGNSLITDERDLKQIGGNYAGLKMLNYAADTGSINAYAVAPTPAIGAYVVGQAVMLKPATANSGACTLAVSGLSIQNIKMRDGSNPPAGALSGMSLLIYDGTNFILQTAGSIAANSALVNNSSASATALPLTLTTNTLLGLGSSNIIAMPIDSITMIVNASSYLAVNAGTSSGQIVQLGVGGALPAVSGANLTGINSVNQMSAVTLSTAMTSVTFTGIPATAKNIKVILASVTTNGTSPLSISLGSTSGFTTSGYAGSINNQQSGAAVAFSSAFLIQRTNIASDPVSGIADICNISSNKWVETSMIAAEGTVGTTTGQYGAGNVPLSSALSQVKILPLNGTDAFGTGTINLSYQ